jgi:transcriptional regulator of acetoin/glycerol metabolism
MLNIFKRKEKDDLYYRLLDFELKLEHLQKQTDELRDIVLTLSKDINSLQIEINYLSNTKYGKGL